jgi:hypothetical protein
MVSNCRASRLVATRCIIGLKERGRCDVWLSTTTPPHMTQLRPRVMNLPSLTLTSRRLPVQRVAQRRRWTNGGRINGTRTAGVPCGSSATDASTARVPSQRVWMASPTAVAIRQPCGDSSASSTWCREHPAWRYSSSARSTSASHRRSSECMTGGPSLPGSSSPTSFPPICIGLLRVR